MCRLPAPIWWYWHLTRSGPSSAERFHYLRLSYLSEVSIQPPRAARHRPTPHPTQLNTKIITSCNLIWLWNSTFGTSSVQILFAFAKFIDPAPPLKTPKPCYVIPTTTDRLALNFMNVIKILELTLLHQSAIKLNVNDFHKILTLQIITEIVK